MSDVLMVSTTNDVGQRRPWKFVRDLLMLSMNKMIVLIIIMFQKKAFRDGINPLSAGVALL